MSSHDNYDIFQVISSSSPNYIPPANMSSSQGRRTSMPADSIKNSSQKEPERKRSILASDGIGLFQLSFEFHSNFDRNGPDRSALRRRHTVDIEANDTAPVSLPRTTRPKLVRQINSVQSNDSAFVDDLCDSVEMDDDAFASRVSVSYHRLEELVNQMSLESNDADTPDIISSSKLMKLRSASVDSGYLDTVSSVSSNVCWNEKNDGLTVVDEDDYHEPDESEDDRFSHTSSKFDADEEFGDSFNEVLNRLLSGRKEIFHADTYDVISSRTLKRIFENVIFKVKKK